MNAAFTVEETPGCSYHRAVSVDQARQVLAGCVRGRPAVETVALGAAVNRIVAASVYSPVDVPMEDSSAMDGYAIKAYGPLHGTEAILPVSGSIMPGQPKSWLAPGTAVEIGTGAVIPAGANTVVPYEYCERRDGRLFVSPPLDEGRNIRRAGEDFAAGDQLLCAGQVLTVHRLAPLMAAGVGSVKVHAPLRVAVVSVGSELRPADSALASGQRHDLNGPLIAAFLEGLGCQVVETRRIADCGEALRAVLDAAVERCDLVVTSGGVSAGAMDVVRALLAASGEIVISGVRMKPGKPFTFAYWRDKPVIALPGNPVAAYVGLCVLARPFIRRCQGCAKSEELMYPAKAGFQDPYATPQDRYLLASRCAAPDGSRWVAPLKRQGAAMTLGLARADALLHLPAGTVVRVGDMVDYYDLHDLASPR